MKEDPYDASEPPHRFECIDCGERISAQDRPGDCPECGGPMRNISKPREK